LTVRVNGQDVLGETIGVQAEKLRARLAEAGATAPGGGVGGAG